MVLMIINIGSGTVSCFNYAFICVLHWTWTALLLQVFYPCHL